ncbi:MAG: barstar family protein [Rhizobiaceae bacterium]|nr:barstar family protein [Rhizobiaceae bacterium]
MRNWDEFSSTMAKALKFPAYYGQNWDAYDEVMRDLSWLELSELIIVIFNAEKLLRERVRDRTIFQSGVEMYGEYWNDPAAEEDWPELAPKPMPFHVILFSATPLSGYNAPLYQDN